jgi:hypothetical protein
MVTTLNITLTDEVVENARSVKQARDLTWAQYIEVAAEELEKSDTDTVSAEALAEEVDPVSRANELLDKSETSKESQDDNAE